MKRNFPLFAVAVCLSVIMSSARPTHAQHVYTVGNTGQYGYFDLLTRQYTQVSNPAIGGKQIVGFAFSPTQGAYVLDRPGVVNYNLLRINPFTGAILSTLTVDKGEEFLGLSFAPDNTLYTYSFSRDTLETVNTVTGVVTSKNVSNFVVAPVLVGKLAFAGAGRNVLYGTMNLIPDTSNGLYRFNTTTGTATFVGNGGARSTYSNMITFGNGTDLYGVNSNTLYQINQTNGALTSLGAISGTGIPTEFAGAVVIIPEPGTLWLLVSGGVAFGALGIVRHRKAA